MADKEYIERERLLKQFEVNEPQNWTNSDSEIQEEIDYACYRGLVETAPAADVVEVRHGKWVPSLHHYGLYMCSECRCSDEKCQPVFDRKNSWKSCPNCGATMDGKGDA